MTRSGARTLDVVGAVVVRSGLVLCAQRGSGPLAGLWEFPGGKVEGDEAPPAALAREIREELGCGVEVGNLVTTTFHAYDHIVVRLSTYLCTLAVGEPHPTEHTALRWLTRDELPALTWAPADVPTVRMITSRTVSLPGE